MICSVNEQPLISVILPTYKPGDYIAECLGALGCQTISPDAFELLIVLNGCNEPWYSEIERLIKLHLDGKNVTLIQTDCSGVSNARNVAIDIAKGEYITFIDDDDYVSPAYLEELLKHSNRGCVALTDCVYFDDKSREEMVDNAHHRNFVKNHNATSPSLFKTRVFFNGPVMKLLHRDIIGARRFDVRFANGEDNLMMFCISDRIKKVSFTSPSAIYYRRIRENSATTRQRSRIQRIKNSLRIMVEYSRYLSMRPFGYNPAFVLSRFAAEIKSMLID